jgi:hypothetical protein
MVYTLLPLGVQVLLATLLVVLGSFRLRTLLGRQRRTDLRGPPAGNFLLGKTRDVTMVADRTANFEQWEKEYGSVYRVPLIFGTSNVVICDVKAATQVHARDSYTYVIPSASRRFRTRLVSPICSKYIWKLKCSIISLVWAQHAYL